MHTAVYRLPYDLFFSSDVGRHGHLDVQTLIEQDGEVKNGEQVKGKQSKSKKTKGKQAK